jgi:hypothetical protein
LKNRDAGVEFTSAPAIRKDEDLMTTRSYLHLFLKITLLLVVAGAAALAFRLVSQTEGMFGTDAQNDNIIGIICALILCLTMIFLLRLTRASWFLSLLGGGVTITIYFIFMYAIFYILDAFIRAMIFG